MLSQFQTIVNQTSGVQNPSGYNSKNFTYAANAGNVIVGFDINSGCAIDGITAVYTVPSSNLTATPTQSVLNPAFMGDVDTAVYTGANGEGLIAGGNRQSLMAPSGSFINGFNVVMASTIPINVGYIQFTYVNPATGVSGLMTTSSFANGCKWWNSSTPVVAYAGSTVNSALVGFSCFSSQYFGGFTQAMFYDYVADAALKNSQKPTTTVASSDAGGTSVASVPSSMLSGIPMNYIYILLVLLVVLGAVYYKKHNSVTVYPQPVRV